MNIFEVESKFESSNGMEELLTLLQGEYFDKIDYHSNLFREGRMSDTAQLHNTIEDLTGIFMELKSIYMIAMSIKENREDAYYMAKKIEVENRGEKFVSASAEREASSSVANERRVRNIIQGKLEACIQGITTIQSKMKFVGKEMELSN